MLYVPSYLTSSHSVIPEKRFEFIEANRVHAAGGALLQARKDSMERERRPNPKIIKLQDEKDDSFSYPIEYRGKKLYISSILTHPDAEPLKDRIYLDPNLIKSKKKLVSFEGGFSNFNLGGCPDWNCEFVSQSDYQSADVLIMQARNKIIRKPNQLVVFFSQESPQNSASLAGVAEFFNFTLGFRHDSPGASPYGYTVKLAKQSVLPSDFPVVDESLVRKKSKGASWYVSHCGTQSHREDLVKELKKFMQVDVYGACGEFRCAKGTSCENSIDEEYHFYMSLENSICEDYITEKLWNQGYSHTVVPIVLKRSLVEPYAPPNSFIAFDDYKTVEEMGKHLNYLMENKEEYLKYFEWKRNYAVIYLDGRHHDILERPWGFCQLCRVAHILDSDPTAASKMKLLSNENLGIRWDKSCDPVGHLASNILQKSLSNINPQIADKFAGNQNGILVESQMRVH